MLVGHIVKCTNVMWSDLARHARAGGHPGFSSSTVGLLLDSRFRGNDATSFHSGKNLPLKGESGKGREARRFSPSLILSAAYITVNFCRLSNFPLPACPSTLPLSTMTSPRESVRTGHPMTWNPSCNS
jgi:hypothetical protein